MLSVCAAAPQTARGSGVFPPLGGQIRWAHEVVPMNPRWRRLVIPGALTALIVVVVVAAILR